MQNRILIIQDLKQLLISKFGNNIINVILFGSQASNTRTSDSDYDILIILKNKPEWNFEREISDVCYEIDLKYNIITDVHILSQQELYTLRGKQPIFINAINNGIYA